MYCMYAVLGGAPPLTLTFNLEGCAWCWVWLSGLGGGNGYGYGYVCVCVCVRVCAGKRMSG